MTNVKNRELARAIRQALLMIVDAIERWLDMEHRTAELRKLGKATRKE